MIFIHIGYPKTGTTTLQMHLFQKHSQIEYLGKFIPSFGYAGKEIGEKIQYIISTPDHLYKRPEKIELKKSDRTQLVSSENFLHPEAVPVSQVAHRIHDLFGDVKIIITLRRQQELLQSFYLNHGRYGQYLYGSANIKNKSHVFELSCRSWLQSIKESPYKNINGLLFYYSIYKVYREIFSNICVLPFEEYIYDKSSFVDKLCKFINVDTTEALTHLGCAHENATLSIWGRIYMQFFRYFNLKEPFSLEHGKNILTSKAKFVVSEEINEYCKIYAEENVNLEKELNINLNKYKYTLD
jgi:hypothetical protein